VPVRVIVSPGGRSGGAAVEFDGDRTAGVQNVDGHRLFTGQHEGSVKRAVRCERCDDPRAESGRDDRAAGGEGVRGAAGRGGHDDPVAPPAGEHIAVDGDRDRRLTGAGHAGEDDIVERGGPEVLARQGGAGHAHPVARLD